MTLSRDNGYIISNTEFFYLRIIGDATCNFVLNRIFALCVSETPGHAISKLSIIYRHSCEGHKETGDVIMASQLKTSCSKIAMF